MDALLFFLLATGAVWKEIFGIAWSTGLPADAMLYACAGDAVPLPWNISVATGESVLGVEWFFDGSSDEMIAMLSHGSFFPLPSFSGRVELTANQGLVLHHVTVGDSGNYTMEFSARKDNGSVVTLRRTAALYISDSILTLDRTLKVRMSAEAKVDNSSKEWMVVLKCGTFVHTSRPPFDVTWVTPEGVEKNSSGYDAGDFTLFIQPLDSGTYTCRVPVHPLSYCVQPTSGHPEEGRVLVDRIEARMVILESRQRALEVENEKLREKGDELEMQMTDGSAGQVSFHVRLFTTQHLPTWTKLVMTEVISNHGNAYSNVTGEFVAPYDAAYFFIASTAVFGRDNVANFFLMVDDAEVHYAYTNSGGGHSEGSSVHAVVTLTRGQRVWLRSYQESDYGDGPTAFSGFLIYHTGN